MKRRNIKLLALAAAVVMAVAAFAGCSLNQTSTNVSNSTSSGSSAAGEEGVTAQVKLTYVNDAYDGTAGGERLIRGVDAEVKVAEDDDAAVIMAMFELLKTVPADLANASTCVNDSFTVGSVKVKSGVAFVDIESVNENVNADTEQFFVCQIADSVIASFDNISAVKFTVNGEEAQSLAGYADVSSALTRDVIDSFNDGGATEPGPSDQSYLGRVDENGDILE